MPELRFGDTIRIPNSLRSPHILWCIGRIPREDTLCVDDAEITRAELEQALRILEDYEVKCGRK